MLCRAQALAGGTWSHLAGGFPGMPVVLAASAGTGRPAAAQAGWLWHVLPVMLALLVSGIFLLWKGRRAALRP